MGEITVEILSKKTEYKKIIDHFKQWKTWQKHYFFCHYTKTLHINILEILLTDFEPLYHSGYNELTDNICASISLSSNIAGCHHRRTRSNSNKRSRIPEGRLEHTHATETEFDEKNMSDYILQPNPINMEIYSQNMDTELMKKLFLDELQHLSQIYSNWESYEFIHLVHLLFPYCSKKTLLYLSSCVNMRVYSHDMVIRLPERAVRTILSHLTPKDLCTTALVSKLWRNISYKSSSWRVHAHDLNFTGIDFSSFAKRAEDTIWRRIYIELYELSKQKVVKPRMRFGSILQSFQTVPQIIEAGRKARRKTLVPEMLEFQLGIQRDASKLLTIAEGNAGPRLSSTPALPTSPFISSIMKLKDQTKSYPRRSLEEVEKQDPARKGSRPLPAAPTQGVTMSPSKGTTPLRIVRTPALERADAGAPNHDQGLIFPDKCVFDEVPRVASIHGSCCKLDELAYEDVTREPKRHGDKHVQFVKQLTGYSNWMSALATIYPLKQVTELLGHKQPVLTFQADALRIISGCKNGVLRLWDAKTGRPVKKTVAHSGAVNSLQFDGYKIVTGGWDNSVKIFSITTLECVSVLTGHCEAVTSVFFNKAHLVSTSLDKTIRIYHATDDVTDHVTAKYSCEHVITGHEAGITHGDMDEDRIVSGSLDHTIRVWCAKFYNPVRTIHCGAGITHFTFDHDLVLAATTDKRLLFLGGREETPSHAIACEHNVNYIWLYGSRFITGDSAGLLKEWDLPSGALLRTLYSHLGEIFCVQANREQIISSSFDGSVKIWQLAQLKSTDKLLE